MTAFAADETVDRPTRGSAWALGHFPVVLDMRPRFGDVDPQRHLNNVSQASYFEEGMMGLHRHALDESVREPGAGMVLKVTIEYRAQGRYPDPLQLGSGILRLGRSSYALAQGLFQNDRCISVCETVIVYTQDGSPTPLPHSYRTGLGRLLMRDLT